MKPPPDTSVLALIDAALEEDIGTGDVTTDSLVPADTTVQAALLAREDCVVCGCDIAQAVFHRLDKTVSVNVAIPDGQYASPGSAILSVKGPAAPILTGERTALNFMQRLTGIATLTRKFVRAVAAHRIEVVDTRKTTPGLRVLEKYAVECGGGRNHRMGLHDMVLIKDNHRRIWAATAGGGSLADAVNRARSRFPGLPVEVEVEDENQLRDALASSPDWILLDNMTPAALSRCVKICSGKCRLEASGNITLANVDAVAASGIDAVSVGCLTHSAPSADLSLEFTHA